MVRQWAKEELSGRQRLGFEQPVGEQDVDWLPGAALFEENLPNVRRGTIQDAEHHPHQENRAAFLEALESHLARVATKRPN